MGIPTKNINFQGLELRFSQLLKIADRSRASKFSDIRKTEFHDTLIGLVQKISQEDFSKFNEEKLFETYHIIEKVFGWFEYLVNSTINQTPYEIISSLEEVLKDWISNRESYVILTSLSNRRNDFAFYSDDDKDPRLSKGILDFIQKNYEVTIKHKVILIVLPKFLSHDYLTAVSLYHEIAHFIDRRFEISVNVLSKLGLKLTKRNYIPYREHFADLFAAQYVNLASCSHISYLTFNKEEDPDDDYPSTAERIEVVSKFLDRKANEKVSEIKGMVKKCTGKELKIRYKKVSEKDFNNLIPTDIKEPAELHGLYVKTWEIWMNPKSHLRKAFANKNDLYRILNNLLEKSISNYFLKRNWNSSNVLDKKGNIVIN